MASGILGVGVGSDGDITTTSMAGMGAIFKRCHNNQQSCIMAAILKQYLFLQIARLIRLIFLCGTSAHMVDSDLF